MSEFKSKKYNEIEVYNDVTHNSYITCSLYEIYKEIGDCVSCKHFRGSRDQSGVGLSYMCANPKLIQCSYEVKYHSARDY